MFVAPKWQSPHIERSLTSAEGIGVTGTYEVHTESCNGTYTTCVAQFGDQTSALAFASVLSWYLDIPEITGMLEDT